MWPLLLFLVLTGFKLEAQDSIERDKVLKAVNEIRQEGCNCGGEVMPPVGSVKWNSILEKTALQHARDMDMHNYFSHRSRVGLDVGQRLDAAGYKWHYAGENMAEGQKAFDEVLRDWLESPTHCKMLMNPRMEEMGLAKYGKYWVQHFGTKMPPNTVRKKVHYREGE